MVDESKNTILKARIREMRDNGLIDFQDKTDYTPKLNLLSKDFECDYTTSYKAMKLVAKESGKPVNDQDKKSTKKKDFKFEAKGSGKIQNDLQKKKLELDAKKTELESQVAMSEMVLKSGAFEMMKTGNGYTLAMLGEIVGAFGGMTPAETKCHEMGGMLAHHELQNGYEVPKHLGTAMLILGLVGLFVIPNIPKIKEFFSQDEETKEEKEKTSESPLDDVNEGLEKEATKK